MQWLLALGMASVALGCAGERGPVSVYMRNDLDEVSTFAFRPVEDPTLVFGIPPAEVGGGCVIAPAGWDFVRVDTDERPDQWGGEPVLHSAMLPIAAETKPRSIWAWVDANGLVRSGEGVPAWWTGEEQNACR